MSNPNVPAIQSNDAGAVCSYQTTPSSLVAKLEPEEIAKNPFAMPIGFETGVAVGPDTGLAGVGVTHGSGNSGGLSLRHPCTNFVQ